MQSATLSGVSWYDLSSVEIGLIVSLQLNFPVVTEITVGVFFLFCLLLLVHVSLASKKMNVSVVSNFVPISFCRLVAHYMVP